jgi:hypothetical protein
MSQNDLIVLAKHHQQWLDSRGAGFSQEVDPFVYYCFEQFLKQFDLSDEELELGVTDGSLDGGVDGLYFLVDGELVRDDTELDPKTANTVDVILFQVKNKESGFQPLEVDKLLLAVDDLFDLSRHPQTMKSKYNPQILGLMQLFRDKYQLIATGFPKVNVTVDYITRADGEQPNDSALSSAAKVIAKVKSHLKSDCAFNFINAQALLQQLQVRMPSTRTLAWFDSPLQTDDGYIGLVSLDAYYKFITDDDVLARRIFESNVRGWQGSTIVNKQIQRTLEKDPGINFWLLNNGITILTTEGGLAGPKRLNLRDARVVNGLQTSRAIYEFFRTSPPSSEHRTILVRVIETKKPDVFNAVVRATNSQNKMPAASLRSTDLIHGHIEVLFKSYDLYYDQRKGVHKDEGRPVAKIVSVIEVLQAVVAVILQRPDDSRARPGTYLTDEGKYQAVFGSDKFNLLVYLKCTQLLRRVDSYLASQPDLERSDRTNIRFYVASMLACEVTGTFPPTPDAVAKIDIEKINNNALEWSFATVWKKFQKLGRDDGAAKGPDLLKQLRKLVKSNITRRASGSKSKRTVS